MDDWWIGPMGRDHVREAFACGGPSLDDFIRRLVGHHERRNLGRTYVAVRRGEPRVLGYFMLAYGSVAFERLPEAQARKLPKHPVPVGLLARLAVDRTAQGRGLGEALLIDALRRCLGPADSLGIHAVRVDAIDATARAFYENYGFVPLLDRGLDLFLPIATIRDAYGKGED